MPEIINWKLVANPVNWVIVTLMLLVAGYGLHILLPDYKSATGKS